MRGVHAAAGRLRGTHPETNHTDAEGDGGCSAEAYEGGKAALKHRTTPKRLTRREEARERGRR